jgi:2-polyprenyl-6-hydroxyphenyl methylase / 3-demethylubiquinone-9 3-methyltransferase
MEALRVSHSVDQTEVEKFSALAAEWWDPSGKFAPLHKFNPVRLNFIRTMCASHFGSRVETIRAFAGLSLLDVGCGGGLLSEPLARTGFSVTGIDPSPACVAAADAHAREDATRVEYQCTTVETLAEEAKAYDVVLAMETVEHVADVRAFVRTCTALVRPGGLMFIATLNKTLKSLALAKIGAEYLLRWLPPGTHDWNRFIDPRTLRRMLEESGLNPLRTQGVTFDPLAWDWKLTDDVDVNYIVVASR